MNAPLGLPEIASVSYADWSPADQLAAIHTDLASTTSPDIVTDIETMHGIGDGSQDFIIANHVIEHVESPFRAIASVMRVLRSGGIAFITLPDKRFTFDKTRDLTSLDHLVRDYREGPEWSVQGSSISTDCRLLTWDRAGAIDARPAKHPFPYVGSEHDDGDVYTSRVAPGNVL